MSCFVISNLVVTAGMLTPNLTTTGTVLWQVANQSLNVAINSANANKTTPLTTAQLSKSYCLAVSASCFVAVGLRSLVPRLKRLGPTTKTVLTRLVPFAAVASAGVLNVFLMRGEEIRKGIDVYPVPSPRPPEARQQEQQTSPPDSDLAPDQPDMLPETRPKSLGKSRIAAIHAVSQTAVSRVFNATPIMVLPPLILLKLHQRSFWLQNRPSLLLPLNLGLILTTSVVALPLALAVFPQRQTVGAGRLEREFWGRGGEARGEEGMVEFNRGV